jgi:polysaccharide biosynthesis/export protein
MIPLVIFNFNRMKLYLIIFTLSAIILQTSCRSSKDLTMFQDLQNNVSLSGAPGKAPEYIIKPFDNLYLNILTLEPEINALFNPTMSSNSFGAGTQQMFGDRPSQYINGYMVQADGTIILPILGQLEVAGLNLVEARSMIMERAEEYLKEPNVKVKVLNFKVNVTGEVRNPGIYYNYEGNLSVLDAISMANGITDFADLKNVLVIRHNENSTETFNIDFTDRSVYLSDAFYLQPDDVVYIKPNKFKGSRDNNTVYSLIISTFSTIATLLVAISVFMQ